MKDGFPVSVAELIAAGARPFPAEAVAILLDVCEQVARQPAGRSVLPAITPSALFIDGSGTVAVAGGVPVEDDQTVQLLGRLLLQMLPAPGSLGAARVPSRLRSLAARAADGQLRRLSVGRLAASLRRFAPQHPPGAVRALFERWRGAEVPDFAAFPAPASPESWGRPVRPPSRGFPRRAVGALVAALLILAGVGAAYWLNADAPLPPIPLSPSLLISEPPAPPRDGWELLDPAGLAVDTTPGHDAPGGGLAGRAAADRPDLAAKASRAQPEPVAVHRPDQ